MNKLVPFLAVMWVFTACDKLRELDQKVFKKEDTSTSWTDQTSKNKPQTIPWKGEAVAADTFIKIANIADAAVVNISTTKIIKQRRAPHPFSFGPEPSPFGDFFGDDELLKRFFGESPDGPDQKQQSLGSGFVMSEDGYIATNNHVVEKADEIQVTIGKDKEYKATLVGSDPKTDLALLKIDTKEKLTTLSLGDSDQLQVGEIVVAIGNPFGLSHTVTQGIVSAKERSIGTGTAYDNFIQTDASINPGNSGGPLLNLKAEVVGINTAIIASGQGIGFAIPITLAKNVLQQLREKGTVTRGWLGVYIQKVDPDLAKSLGLKDSKGALVSQVQKGSPAEKVGILQGDVITQFNGKPIHEFNDLPRLVATTEIGKKAKIDLLRNGKPISVEVVIKELKATKEADNQGLSDDEKGEGEELPQKEDKLGLTVQNLTPDISKDLQLEPGTVGVVVAKANPTGPAAGKGITRGDVIVQVNSNRVRNADEYRKSTKLLKKGDVVRLLIKRGADGQLFVAFYL